jgi:hypothetical protein
MLPCMICGELVYPIGITVSRIAPSGEWKVIKSRDFWSSRHWSKEM